MSGAVTGGWEFVIAAYVVTAVVLIVYSIAVLVRVRSEQRRWKRDVSAQQEAR